MKTLGGSMKSMILVNLLNILIFALPAGAATKTVLHVPFFVEVSSGPQNSPNYDYVPVAVFNKTFVQKGQPAQLEFVDIDVDSKFDAYANREKVDAAIEAAGIKNTQSFGEGVPAEQGDKNNYTCYRGNAEEVIDVVLNNTDNLYSDQYSMIAWRTGKKIVLSDYLEDGDEMVDFLNSESPLWKKYDEKSDSVLILASTGDDGTDVQESLIPRCK
jgi:hypothetical protein